MQESFLKQVDSYPDEFMLVPMEVCLPLHSLPLQVAATSMPPLHCLALLHTQSKNIIPKARATG